MGCATELVGHGGPGEIATNAFDDAGAEAGALPTLLRTREEELLAPENRASPERVAELLADDFIEFARSGGIYDRDRTIAALADDGAGSARRAFDFQVSLLGDGVALLTYRSIRQAAPKREEQHALRSSIWVWVRGRWRMRFHQGAPIR